jgi:hypothetical protein
MTASEMVAFELIFDPLARVDTRYPRAIDCLDVNRNRGVTSIRHDTPDLFSTIKRLYCSCMHVSSPIRAHAHMRAPSKIRIENLEIKGAARFAVAERLGGQKNDAVIVVFPEFDNKPSNCNESCC